MSRRLPSLKALRAFEAAARLLSIKDAADELFVTPSAVSRHVQALEEELDVKLFRRYNRGLALTDAGLNYSQGLTQVFGSLSRLTEEIRGEPGQDILRLYLPHGFNAVLTSRLRDFERRHPEVEVQITCYSGMDGPDFQTHTADAAVVMGFGYWEGLEAWCLHPRPFVVPACAPDLLPAGEPVDFEELAEQTWLYNSLSQDAWAYWCYCAGVPGLKPRRKLVLDSGAAVTQAARAGLGVMLAHSGGGVGNPWHTLGGLQPAHGFHAFLGTYTLYLTYRPQALNKASVQAFCDWLIETFQARRPPLRPTALEHAANAVIAAGRNVAPPPQQALPGEIARPCSA